MLISTKGRYALRVLVDMAEHQSEGHIPLKEIAERQDISEKYLESIVKELVKNGIVSGVRGKGGGYQLCRPPEQIVTCPRIAECRTLEFWRGLDEVIRNYTSSRYLSELMRTGESGNDYVI